AGKPTRKCHSGGHPTSSIQAPAAHAHNPDPVHTGDRQHHGQTALGSKTRREARKQARGQVANEKCLTARRSATRRERQLLYFQYTPYCSSRRKTTVSSNFLRHCVSRRLYTSLCTTDQTCPSTSVLPSAPSLLFMV